MARSILVVFGACFAMRFTTPLALAVALISATAASAQPQAVAQFRDWDVFVRDVDGDKICFAATIAKEKAPKSVNHGDVIFIVATWKSGASVDQPSLMTGYNLKDAPVPSIRVGSEKWNMYVSENEAFIESKKSEEGLISAMRRGADMRVAATSARGTATSYSFSLSGISAALDRVSQECQ
jgi:invasion protein IalB